MNVDVSKLAPGVFGVSHGAGLAGDLIRTATGSWAGHAFLYLGDGLIVQGQPPRAVIAPAGSHADAIWAWQMWDKLGLAADEVKAAQGLVVARGHALAGALYDFPAYAAFAAEVLHLRSEQDLAGYFGDDKARVCSALVADALEAGKVPLDFIPSDGPGLIAHPDTRVVLPPNLVAPGMLLGLAQRSEWT